MIKRITDISVKPSRPGMGTVSFVLSLWNDGENPAVDSAQVTQSFSLETKTSVEGVTTEELGLRIEPVLTDCVNGWTEQWDDGQKAAESMLPEIEAIAIKITGV